MKNPKQHTLPLPVQLLIGQQLSGLIQVSGRPATNRGGFLLDINFTLQSSLRKDVCGKASNTVRNTDERMPAANHKIRKKK